jgi:hypothetical protein
VPPTSLRNVRRRVVSSLGIFAHRITADYSLNDVSGDVDMKHFSLDKAANSVEVLKDIVSINKRIQLHLVPWSPVSMVELVEVEVEADSHAAACMDED